jgi:hypothetical protein
MTYDERRELAARLDGVLRNETWEFTDAEQKAAEKVALFDAKHGTARLLADAVAELRRVEENSQDTSVDQEIIERLETALRRDDDVRED